MFGGYMKNTILIFSLLMISLAISSSAFAMVRGASRMPSRQPSSRAPQRSFSFKKQPRESYHAALKEIKEQKFPLPALPSHRISPEVIRQHENLCVDWYFAKRKSEEDKKLIKKGFVSAVGSLVSTPIGTGALMYGLYELNILPGAFFAGVLGFAGGGTVHAAMKFVIDGARSVFSSNTLSEQKSIEAELAALVKEQKREFKIADDLQ